MDLLAAQGLQGFFAAHGLHGFFAAHGLQGLQGFFAAHGLHGLHAFFLAAQGLQGLHAASSMISEFVVVDAACASGNTLMAPTPVRAATLTALIVFLNMW